MYCLKIQLKGGWNVVFGFVFLGIILFMDIATFKFGWNLHWGISIYMFFLPVVLGIHWRYVFASWRENELGGYVSDRQTRIALRADESSPLYVKGQFRKNYKKNPNSRMAKLKGHYFCQIIALIQMAVMLIRLIYIIISSIKYEKAGLVYDVLWPEALIVSWVLINVVISLLFTEYYQWILKSVRLQKQKDFYKEKEVCIKAVSNNNYEDIYYKNTLNYKKLLFETSYEFQNRFCGRGESFFESKADIEDSLIIDIDEDRENNCPQILVQMYQKRLKQEHIDLMNQFIRKTIRYTAKRSLPFGFPHVTYVIYVDQKTSLFEDIFCGELRQRKSFHCLPIGVVLSERKLYIPKIKKGSENEVCEKMRATIFDILEELSLKYPSSVMFKKAMKEVDR